MVGIDIVGPLKNTKHSNCYIVSVIDYYTKYAEAEALLNQQAETVVRALEAIFARHGMSSIIITDQGTNFESYLFLNRIYFPACVNCLVLKNVAQRSIIGKLMAFANGLILF